MENEYATWYQARTFGKANPGYLAREVGRLIACSMRGGQKQVQTFNFRLKCVSYRVDTIKIRKSRHLVKNGRIWMAEVEPTLRAWLSFQRYQIVIKLCYIASSWYECNKIQFWWLYSGSLRLAPALKNAHLVHVRFRLVWLPTWSIPPLLLGPYCFDYFRQKLTFFWQFCCSETTEISVVSELISVVSELISVVPELTPVFSALYSSI